MRIILFFAALLITVAASLPFSNSARAGNTDLGEKLFNDHCIVCHAGGENVIAPDHDLSKNALYKYLGSSSDPGAIKKRIVFGGTLGMPPFGGKITDEDIDAIAAYVLMKADQGW